MMASGVAYLFELYQKLGGELFVEEKKRGKGANYYFMLYNNIGVSKIWH
jgi:hypothetical protein